MIITDAGPLAALVVGTDTYHRRATESAAAISFPMVTTWAAFTEAMYIATCDAGAPARRALWRLVSSGTVRLADLPQASIQRCAELMEQYADTPMDLADATLVALAEHLGERDIFTLDDDFRIYRTHGKHPFRLIPG